MQTPAAVKIAIALSDGASRSDEVYGLAEYLSTTVSPAYSLCRAIENGVAYHHGAVPAHARHVIESAYSHGLISTIVCTTTLMQGVNLPAKYVVARSPALSGNSTGPNLTGYEFANLRGRAGRLMQDFVGRSLVLDLAAFESQEIDLFDYPDKDIATGYADRYRASEESIVEHLRQSTPAEQISSEQLYIVTHIRQMIVRHGKTPRLDFDVLALSCQLGLSANQSIPCVRIQQAPTYAGPIHSGIQSY